jgi:hypothetical protein
MQNQRNIKELLSILLDNIHNLQSGLCNLSYLVMCDHLITDYEYDTLIVYINKNRPSKFSSIAAFKSRHSVFFWEDKLPAPRIKWLKKHIKLNSK